MNNNFTIHRSIYFRLSALLGLLVFLSSMGIAKTASTYTVKGISVDDAASFCNIRVWFKNQGCKTMEIFRVENGRERHKRNVNPNGTAEFDATKGDQFVIRVDGRRIKDWKVPRCENQTQMIDTKGCNENCRVRIGFRNTGCNRLNIFRFENGKERHVGHINPNETTQVDASKGQKFRFRTVERGTRVKDWTANSCNSSTQRVNSGDCECNVRVWFKNTGCVTMDIFRIINGKERREARVNANGTAEFNAPKGDRFIVRVGNRKIKDWRVPNCNNQTQQINSGGCNARPNCNDIQISTSRGKITVKGLKKAPISEVQIRNSGGKQVTGCRRCNSDSKTFRVNKGNYWVTVIYYDKSFNRVCDRRKDVRVNLTDEQSASTGRTIGTKETNRQTTNKNLSHSPLSTAATTTTTLSKTGLESAATSNITELSTYPNPAHGTLFIDVPSTSNHQPLVLNLLNMRGEVVATKVVTGDTASFNLSNQPSGIYLVRLQLEDGQVITSKVLVRSF